MALIGRINEVCAQAFPSPRLQAGLNFLKDLLENRSPDLASRAGKLTPGEKFEVAIEGKDVFAIIQCYDPRERKNGFFEAHKAYTDIQCLLGGEEAIDVVPLAARATPAVYDANENLFFPIDELPGSRFLMTPGIVAILFPEDAHAPSLRVKEPSGAVHKIVIKIRNSLS